MGYLVKPITKKMLLQLVRAREVQSAPTGENDFLTGEDFKGTLAGLYRRGLVNTEMKTRDGKQIMRVYITGAGLNFLTRYEADRKASMHGNLIPVQMHGTDK